MNPETRFYGDFQVWLDTVIPRMEIFEEIAKKVQGVNTVQPDELEEGEEEEE